MGKLKLTRSQNKRHAPPTVVTAVTKDSLPIAQWSNAHMIAIGLTAVILGWIGGHYTASVSSPHSESPKESFDHTVASPQPELEIHANLTTDSRRVCDPTALIEWVQESTHGSYIHPALRVWSLERDADEGNDRPWASRGVFADSSIERGQKLFSVKDALSLTATRTFGSDKLKRSTLAAALRTVYINDDTTAMEYTNLAAALVFERRQGELSTHWQYINCLPPLSECPSLPCFTASELLELNDPYAANVANTDRRNIIRSLHNALAQLEMDKGTVEELIWGFGMVLSRAFVHNGVPRLIPFVDFLNHNPTSGGIHFSSPSSSTSSSSSSSSSSSTFSSPSPSSSTPSSFSSSSSSSSSSPPSSPSSSPSSSFSSPSSVLESRDVDGSWQKEVDLVDTIHAGDEVSWAYKKTATSFDLLYLYGFVEDGHRGAVSVDLQWTATSSQFMQIGLELFQAVDDTKVVVQQQTPPPPHTSSSESPTPTTTTPTLRISLLFTHTGIDPTTLAYARIITMIDMRYTELQSHVSPHNLETTTTLLKLPSSEHPFGKEVESKALHIILGLVAPRLNDLNKDSVRGNNDDNNNNDDDDDDGGGDDDDTDGGGDDDDAARDGDDDGDDDDDNGDDDDGDDGGKPSTYSVRFATAKAFRKQRRRVMKATFVAAETSLVQMKPPPIDYYA